MTTNVLDMSQKSITNHIRTTQAGPESVQPTPEPDEMNGTEGTQYRNHAKEENRRRNKMNPSPPESQAHRRGKTAKQS